MVTYLLDYGAGNVRSLINAVRRLGYDIKLISSPTDFQNADKIIFPGVGDFGNAMASLREKGYFEPLKLYLKANKKFLGICVGMQALFESSEEAPDSEGLGLIPGKVKRFDKSTKAVPHVGWNKLFLHLEKDSKLPQQPYNLSDNSVYYFVHSFAVPFADELKDWVLTSSLYGDEHFVSMIRKGNIIGTQFHPEKSGILGLKLIRAFLNEENWLSENTPQPPPRINPRGSHLTKRVIACLDVRTNDDGDLVVTKGDQYEVREKSEAGSSTGKVRNLGKPVDTAKKYFEEGADEIVFLNITSFRNCPVKDLPMLEVVKQASETVFVPLTVGGGIQDFTDYDGCIYSAQEIAGIYFRSGADKVSIGSDAVYAAEKYWQSGRQLTGTSAIETISKAYGNQAVVVSVDPKRVYVDDPSSTPHHVISTQYTGPNGERFCWYQCTVSGGRETRDLDVYQLVVACEAMGAGEILLNCIDKDGTNSGFDLELISDVRSSIHIPLIASSGAGVPKHFYEVFNITGAEAALAAGIFHRREVPLESVKQYLVESDILVRPCENSSL